MSTHRPPIVQCLIVINDWRHNNAKKYCCTYRKSSLPSFLVEHSGKSPKLLSEHHCTGPGFSSQIVEGRAIQQHMFWCLWAYATWTVLSRIQSQSVEVGEELIVSCSQPRTVCQLVHFGWLHNMMGSTARWDVSSLSVVPVPVWCHAWSYFPLSSVDSAVLNYSRLRWQCAWTFPLGHFCRMKKSTSLSSVVCGQLTSWDGFCNAAAVWKFDVDPFSSIPHSLFCRAVCKDVGPGVWRVVLVQNFESQIFQFTFRVATLWTSWTMFNCN